MPARSASTLAPDQLARHFKGGDRRSLEGVDAVVALVLAEPASFASLLQGLSADDPIVRMRSADAAQKVAQRLPRLLRAHRAKILRLAEEATQQEVRWHLAQMLSLIELRKPERARAVKLLHGYLSDRSSIVRTFAMQALADIALADQELRPDIIVTIARLTRCGTPAMRARGRKLLQWLRQENLSGE